MKHLLFYCCTCFLCVVSYGQQDSVLRNKIDSLYTVDQQVQLDMLAAYQNNASQNVRDNLNTVKELTFQRHIPILKEIVSQNGLPTYSRVGKASSDNFIVMVNHGFSDIAFQELVGKLSKAEIKKNNLSAPAIAMMIDKMRIHSNRQQLYGTQVDYDSAGNVTPVDLYKPGKVDKRRKEMGLGPLKEYLEMMAELHRRMNQKK